MAQTTPRVLLSAPIRPFGVDNEVCTREMNYDAMTDNAGGGDGLFVPRGVTTTPATHFIANNLNAPSVVLDFASTEELKTELKKAYEFFGISFMTCDLLKAKKMVEIAREVSPRTKIVLGGYGSQTPGVENLGADTGIAECSHIYAERSPSRNHVEHLKKQIADLKDRMPAHSVSPSMMQELEGLEDQLKAAQQN